MLQTFASTFCPPVIPNLLYNITFEHLPFTTKKPIIHTNKQFKKNQAYKKIRRTFIKKKMLMTTDHKTFLKRECAVLKRTLSLIALNGKTRCNFPKCSLNACAVLCAKVHGTLRETA